MAYPLRLHIFLAYVYDIVTGMLPRIIAIVSLSGLIVLLSLLMLTTPATAGPFGLLVIFISAYLSFVGVISFFLFGINRLVVGLGSHFAVKRPLRPMSFRRAYYYSTMLAMAPVMLVGLQSVGAIGVYEVLLVFVFEVIACIYISRRMPI